MNKLHLTYLVLIVVAAVLAVSLSGRSKQRPETVESGKKDAPVTRRKRAPRIRLAGTVLEAARDGTAGKPVKGATVFVLPKKRRGAERDDVPHEVSDAAGRWTLSARTTVAHWIGVVAPGFRNAWLDGDTVDPSFQIVLVVKRAPPLEVQLTDAAGKPVPEQGVQLDPWPPDRFHFLPGPAGRQDGRYGVTDARGVATFHRGDEGPVRISPEVAGHYTSPATTWLADGRGLLKLRVHRSSSLRVHLTQKGGSAKLSGPVTVDLYVPGTGHPVGSYTGFTQEPGLWLLEHELTPGTYDLHVTLDGHETTILEGFTVPAHPEVAVVAVSPEKAAPPARLRLSLEGVGGTQVTRGRRRAPLVYVLRDEDGWRRLSWQVGVPESWDRKTSTLEFLLPPDRFHVLVADVLTGRTAVLRDLDLASGTESERTLRLVPGIRPTLPALCVDGAQPRRLRVGSAKWPALPVYGCTPDARARMGDEIGVISCQLGGESVRLGPYPVPEITLEVVEWSDAVKTYTLK